MAQNNLSRIIIIIIIIIIFMPRLSHFRFFSQLSMPCGSHDLPEVPATVSHLWPTKVSPPIEVRRFSRYGTLYHAEHLFRHSGENTCSSLRSRNTGGPESPVACPSQRLPRVGPLSYLGHRCILLLPLFPVDFSPGHFSARDLDNI
jgi:hypothetical protein